MTSPAQAPEEDPIVGKVLDGRYRVERLLGVGGMGRVYEGVQVDLGRRVALKLLAPELAREPMILERFRREAQAAGVLGNPHIVDVTDFRIPEGGPPFLVMEHLVGESLMDVLQREQRVSVRRAVRITVQLLDALQEAHDAGIIHRDLKPANIFLLSLAGGEEMVKLLDFGVAKLQEGNQSRRLTAVGAVVGTPRFAAPEQLKGGEIDARTDVYGAGVLLYGMLAGRPPFTAPLEDLIRSILEDEPPDVRIANPEVDPHLAGIVQKAMAKDPDDRYASAAEMLAALGGTRAKAGRTGRIRETRPDAPKPVAERPKRRAGLLWLLVPAGLIGLLLAAGAGWAAYAWAEGEDQSADAVASPPRVDDTTPDCDAYLAAACGCPEPTRQSACAEARARVTELHANVEADPAEARGANQWCRDAREDPALCDPTDVEDAEPAPTPAPIAFEGEELRGTIDVGDWRRADGGSAERFALPLEAGERVEVWMMSNELDAYLVLRAPDGRVVAVNDDAEQDRGGTDARVSYVARAAGAYVLEAGAARAGERGGFELTVRRTSEIGGGHRSRRRSGAGPGSEAGGGAPGAPYAVPYPGVQPAAPQGSVPPPWTGR